MEKQVGEAIKTLESDLGDVSQLSGDQKNSITLKYVDAITNLQK